MVIIALVYPTNHKKNKVLTGIDLGIKHQMNGDKSLREVKRKLLKEHRRQIDILQLIDTS